MAKKNVLLVIASQDYQPVEYLHTKDELEHGGIAVTTASDKMGQAQATDGSVTAVDIDLKKVNMTDFDGIFFIGGSGALDHLDNSTSYALLTKAAATNKPCGAICISTRILARAGVLKGKKATGWNVDGKLPDILKKYGASYEEADVMVDGKVVTANGPIVAHQFGLAIVDVLQW